MLLGQQKVLTTYLCFSVYGENENMGGVKSMECKGSGEMEGKRKIAPGEAEKINEELGMMRAR